MSSGITLEEFNLFRKFIERHCGIALGDDKAYLVEHRLVKLLRNRGCACYRELYDLAVKEYGCGELCSQIIDAITTNETAWFRDPKQFEALAGLLLPRLWEKVESGQRARLNIWSAACSTGQEPYTIAMVVDQFLGKKKVEEDTGAKVRILATDISKHSLNLAKAGQYDTASLKRGLSSLQVHKFFRAVDQGWQIDSRFRQMVTFQRFNLQDDPAGLGKFDVIFLRNVIIYFSDDLKKKLFSRIAQCLYPGGWLFLGTGETAGHHTREFELINHGGASLYLLKQ